MGVYIPNMRFPKNCFSCEFSRFLSFDDELYCFNIGTTINGEEKPKECTLVEVPPRGRLIDADKLLRDYQNSLCANVECELCPFCEKPNGFITITFCMIEEWIKNAPTITESEE